jgi:sarcosine oxidase, subunit alpha
VRHADLGGIDRSTPLSFRFDGRELTGFAGDTLASALLANGIHHVSTSVTLGRPRGIVSAGPEEPSAIVQIEAPFPEPMLTATTIELYDGLVASSLSGRGRLAAASDPARNDAVWAHCDVLVVGGGAAAVAAAAAAATSGESVIIADDRHYRPRPAGVRWLPASASVRWLPRTTVVGYYDDNFLVAVERRTNHLGPAAPANTARERVWRIRAGRVVLATGAHERLIPFPDNDRPGIMLAGSARDYLRHYGVLVGRRAVVHTNNDTAYDVARELENAGIEIAAIVDTRSGDAITAVYGEDGVAGVQTLDGDVAADVVLVSGGFQPVLHLYSQAGGRLAFSEPLGAFLPDGCRQAVTVVGAAAGDGLPLCGVPPVPLTDAHDGRTFLDLQRDVTVADVRRATGTGLRSVEHIKRYTTAGTAHDQGKTSGVLTSAAIAAALGTTVGGVGTTTFRPPYVPVAFATLAGRDRGALFDPERVTPMHDWHVAHGATFENVGQWKRAWYFPRDGEDLTSAVARECFAARNGVAMMDASTLGKIDVRGPDAGEFLDRLYTNIMSTLPVGSVRYGVMCGLDGMVFDDGTVARLSDHEFLVTTTTGNAAPVLAWMEEWLQTEWPTLAVRCTSVTEQWATVALVGPDAREVLRRVVPDSTAPDVDLAFMRWCDTTVAGLPARVFRISFSGELAYEVNVAGWHGYALWEALMSAGADLGITPYGTETMHVLRAEKGYPIIGQDTDGTVTPADLGLGWAIRKSPKDFVGRRSLSRPDALRSDRKQLVGLLPEDASVRLEEGAHVLEHAEIGAPPVPYLGHVTSSYASVALGRPFALALVAGGRDRIGTRAYATVGKSLVPVLVTSPVLYDPDGTRRDGPPSDHVQTDRVSIDRLPADHSTADRLPSDRRSHLADVLPVDMATLRIVELPFLPKTNVRGGAALPTVPNTITRSDDSTALWLGPDEWLVVGAPVEGGVDVSAQYMTIAVSGSCVRDVLAHGCALDLAKLGDEWCAQTMLAKANVILAGVGPHEIHIHVRASFARYLAAWLIDAATDCTTHTAFRHD